MILFLGLVLAGMVLADIILDLYIRGRTSESSFVEDVRSKGEHMRQRLAHDAPDAIFIGSSRTIFHISTAEFARAGLDIYNYGVSGCRVADYPSMVRAAVDLHPGRIVISVSVTSFGNSAIAVPELPGLADIRAEVATGQPLGLIVRTGLKMLTDLHRLGRYSQPVNLRLRNLFVRLDRPLVPVSPAHGGGMSSGLEGGGDALGAPLDCTVFDSNVDRAGMRILKCTNGDGILLAKMGDGHAVPPMSWRGIAPRYVALLNYSLDLVRKGGVQPVLVLEPVLGLDGPYDLEAIRAAVHAPILDLTRCPLPLTMWANPTHLNDRGRREYSRILAEALEALPAP